METTISAQPSKGHLCWLVSDNGTVREAYQTEAGELYIANESNVLDCQTGYRIGRWEAPKHLAEQMLASLIECYVKFGGHAVSPEPEPACYTCHDTGLTSLRYYCSECDAGRARFVARYHSEPDADVRAHMHTQVRETLYPDALDGQGPGGPAPAPGAPLAAPTVTGSHQHVCPRCFSHGVHAPEGPCAIPESTLCSWCAPWPDPDPQTPAAREAAQRADEAELQAGLLATLPPMAGGSEDDMVSFPYGTQRYLAGRRLLCRAGHRLDSHTPPGTLINPSHADAAITICRCSRLVDGSCMNLWPGHPAYGTCRCACHAPPMAGGAPSHYDDPAWYADEAWALQAERNAESAREDPEPPETCARCGGLVPVVGMCPRCSREPANAPMLAPS